MGPSIVVFTLGAKVRRYSERMAFSDASFAVDVQDTVGAGDVFHGAYTVGLLRGLSSKEAARLATGVSCIKCTRIGGRAAFPIGIRCSAFCAPGKSTIRKLISV